MNYLYYIGILENVKEWFFFFILIIFHLLYYHSVWFELFGLRVQVHSIRYSLRSRAKDMTITIVIIKPQTGNGAGVWMTSCAEEMGWEFEDFKNHASWGFEIGPCRQTIEFLPLGQRIEFSAIELSFLPSWRRLSFSCPDQRRWIEI